MNQEIRILFAGGGTGGHVFPAIYIAKYLKKIWGARCQFIGTKQGIENIKVPQAGFVLKKIWISGLKRGFYLSNLLFPLKLIVSMIQSRKEIRYFKPDVVIGTGGYVSGPVLYQAAKMKIPTVIQEQNSYPGITTRILAEKVDRVFLAYEESLRYLKNIPIYKILGNPVEMDFDNISVDEARKFFNLKKNIITILVFGGSQGSRNINIAIEQLINDGVLNHVQLIWQTGKAHFETIKNKYKDQKKINLCIFPFIDRMDLAYSICDFAICRSGAMTISELAAAALPAILVPLPHAAANHQFKNAQSVAKRGGALIVQDNSDINVYLKRGINKLCESEDIRTAMSKKIAGFHHPDVLDKMATEIKDLYDTMNLN